MKHIYQEYYDAAKKFDGGLIIFIDLLDRSDIDYVLSSKKPSARISITTRYGTIGVYDRKENKLIRMDIPNNHPLASHYEKYKGFLYNINNKITKYKNVVSVYFCPNSFSDLIEAIKTM